MNSLRVWLAGFVPVANQVKFTERFRACGGALVGILLTGLVSRWVLGPSASLPELVAPMGASAVLLFALPASPLAQPWSIIGGNLVSATLGVVSAQLIAEPVLAAAVAISTAIFAMIALRCLHPPSGAVALTAVLGGPGIHALGFHFLIAPIGLNSLLLVSVALLFNNSTRHRYPHPKVRQDNTHKTGDPKPSQRLGFTKADLDYVLSRYNQVLDISPSDLESLMRQTESQAYRRRFGEITCAEIMSRDIVSVEYGTDLRLAWDLLNKHHIKALPVIDPARRVIGILTQADFLKHTEFQTFPRYEASLRKLLDRTGLSHTDKPEVVGQIMNKTTFTVAGDLPITELVGLVSEQHHRHVPVVDADRRLVGIITNSDLVAGLYRGRFLDQE